ncbi:division plane positioning ATPase MipZ [Azospirillum sp. sgz301742]
MRTKFIVANDKGGVGKSTLAQFCILYLQHKGTPARVVEYDRQPKLQRFFGAEVLTQSIAPDWGAQYANAGALATFWDPVVKWFRVERPLIMDFGAQVWDYFHAWARAVSLPDLVDSARVTVLIPVTADAEAVVGALRVVRSAPEILPKARLIVLFCDKDGDVALMQGLSEFKELQAAIAAGTVEHRDVPVLAREGYPAAANRGWRFDQIYQATPGAFVNATGASLMVAARTIKAVRTWVDGMTQALGDVLAKRGGRKVSVTAVAAAR